MRSTHGSPTMRRGGWGTVDWLCVETSDELHHDHVRRLYRPGDVKNTQELYTVLPLQ